MFRLYKIETHLHTRTSSGCGKLSAEEIVEGYHKAGYHGICVTDHYLRYYFDVMGVSDLPTDQQLHRFLLGYREICKAAALYGIRVYRGAEVRFDEGDNDYLLYGWPDSLLENPDSVFSMGLKKFYPLSRRSGAVLIQAHPFRDGSALADISCVDGIEVYNAHPRHDSQNHLSVLTVQNHPWMIGMSGSDCHRTDDIGRGGILVNRLPENELDLASVLRKKQFCCITSQERED